MKTIYEKYKKSPLWKILKKAIQELEKNQDISITTEIDYVIWYLIKNMDTYEKNEK